LHTLVLAIKVLSLVEFVFAVFVTIAINNQNNRWKRSQLW